MEVFVYLLFIITLLETFVAYIIHKDIINPSVIFSGVFTFASINLMTNIYSVGVTIHIETVLIITCGIFIFLVASLCCRKIKFKIKKSTYTRKMRKRYVDISSGLLISVIAFNLLGSIYVLREVYLLTKEFAHYGGNILGSLSVFAEVSKFGSIGLRVGTVSTLLSALMESEAYVLGYLIVRNIINKEKNNLLIYLAFGTSFLSTFCQGSRGGVFILLTMVIIYILLYGNKTKRKMLNPKIVKRLVIGVIISIILFQLSGAVSGKNWSISIYEYFSVYLGFPIYNLDVALQRGIPRTEIMGLASFNGLYNNILHRLGISVPSYKAMSVFNELNGHNMGNVYTIYGDLIADFGIIGMFFAIFIIGFIMQLLYNQIKSNGEYLSLMTIVYSYLLVCVAFSFFSNKICENVTVFHMYEIVFSACWLILFSKKKKRLSVVNWNNDPYMLNIESINKF